MAEPMRTVEIYPFHGHYPNMPDLFHVRCLQHSTLRFCGERTEAERVRDEHLMARHEEER